MGALFKWLLTPLRIWWNDLRNFRPPTDEEREDTYIDY